MIRQLPVRSRQRAAGLLVGVWLGFAAAAAVAQAQTHPRLVRAHPRALKPAHAHAPRQVPRVVRPPAPASALAAKNALAAKSARARLSRDAQRVSVHRATARAHMAGDPSVSIVDYSFSPGTTTVHVGDTITWTNSGQQPHSAIASDHSFDTGILKNGQSGSHTFSTPGTFSYICIVHPYMHGTVVVLAAATTTTTTTPTNTTPTTTTPTTTTPTTTTTPAGQLPLTGADDAAAFAIGLLMVGAGVALRARVRARAED
jgi:plastocyanin